MKKLKIEEIKIYETFENKLAECPFCVIEEKYEKQLIHSILGERIMDIDFYPKIGNEHKFCENHIEKLNRGSDKLGLAIMLDKIINEEKKKLHKNKSLQKNHNSVVKKLLSLSKNPSRTLNGKANYECFICSKLDENNNDNIKVTIELWKKDMDFRRLYKDSRGFCSNHYINMINELEESTEMKGLDDMYEVTNEIYLKNLERLQEELQWFIKKFDYLNADKPWGTSKDSIQRALQKILGNY
ncbi:DUF6062 family protein [Clostridium fungisolvens]|uniref:ABC transporter substrate-binding protein n=1 Tax=Clostridium fungisolvens TaxID=1604897 RepID=A0A6V8SH55_9CLOT|nr:DUF6062 family protein [Clostridium fungisolvens]GFP76056.1 hypothetical protein bsdtw1_02150 [Clostridium fungisolvens]